MSKGKRQRSNINSPKKATKVIKTILAGNTPSILKDYPVRTLNSNDVNRLKELVGLSNNVIKLIQQCSETDKNIAMGKKVAKDMSEGKIKGPAMQQITPSLYLPLTDIKGVAKKIKSEVETLKQINTTSKVQLSQQYAQYLNVMQSVKQLFEQLLSNAPKQERRVIFEKDVSKLTKKDTEFLKTIKAGIDKRAKK